MTSLLFTISGAVVNASAFSSTNLVFVRLTDHDEKERKRHDLALERLQRARDEWNKDQMKRLDFINKRLHVDEAMLEYYRVFAKQIKP